MLARRPLQACLVTALVALALGGAWFAVFVSQGALPPFRLDLPLSQRSTLQIVNKRACPGDEPSMSCYYRIRYSGPERFTITYRSGLTRHVLLSIVLPRQLYGRRAAP